MIKNVIIGILILTSILFFTLAFKSALNESISNELRPQFYQNGCIKCGKDWNTVKGHLTPTEWSKPGTMHMITGGDIVPNTNMFSPEIIKVLTERIWIRGIEVMCENCWSNSTPTQRLPYYMKPFDWKNWGWDIKDKDIIEKEVLAGN